ncbi:MAG: transporter [Cyclobacteriaceae bacterium]
MGRYVTLAFFLGLSVSASAQFNETIRSGRPGQSIGPWTVGSRILQIQSGMDVFGSKNDNTGAEAQGFLNNTVIRYGVAERLEVSALVDYVFNNNVKSNGTETELTGLAALDVGGRYHIYSGEGLIPSVGFQLRFRLPVLSEDYEIDKVAPRLVIITNQKLSETFTLFTNWGASWNGINNRSVGFYTLNLAFPIAGKLGGFVENYGTLSDGNFNTWFDTGLAYLISNDLQLDLLGGAGKNDGRNDYFISVGVSVRTKRK